MVRTGSFTEAGKELGYTSSAVSQQVAALERSLELRLVEREPAPHPLHPGRRAGSPTRSRHAWLSLAALEDDVRALARGSPAGSGSAPPWTPRPVSRPHPAPAEVRASRARPRRRGPLPRRAGRARPARPARRRPALRLPGRSAHPSPLSCPPSCIEQGPWDLVTPVGWSRWPRAARPRRPRLGRRPGRRARPARPVGRLRRGRVQPASLGHQPQPRRGARPGLRRGRHRRGAGAALAGLPRRQPARLRGRRRHAAYGRRPPPQA